VPADSSITLPIEIALFGALSSDLQSVRPIGATPADDAVLRIRPRCVIVMTLEGVRPARFLE
jgi:hypothetical protein